MEITLSHGTLESNENMDGWVITSASAVAEGAEDESLIKGDTITMGGDVVRNGEVIANIA